MRPENLTFRDSLRHVEMHGDMFASLRGTGVQQPRSGGPGSGRRPRGAAAPAASPAKSGPALWVRLKEEIFVHPISVEKPTRKPPRPMIFGGSGGSWGCFLMIFIGSAQDCLTILSDFLGDLKIGFKLKFSFFLIFSLISAA